MPRVYHVVTRVVQLGNLPSLVAESLLPDGLAESDAEFDSVAWLQQKPVNVTFGDGAQGDMVIGMVGQK